MSTNKVSSEDGKVECPAGIPDCGYLVELGSLRLEVHKLSAQARTDELTGLYNFRHFSQALEVEMERTRRSGKPTSLMVLDLDDFKSINDRYGHEFGNTVLASVASLLKTTIRRLDVASRYGGEEFTVILPDTTLHAAITLAERLRKRIRALLFEINGVSIFPTASFGVDIYHGAAEEKWQQFLERADAYLLKAKRSGKNRVCSPELPPSQGLSADERSALLTLNPAADD